MLQAHNEGMVVHRYAPNGAVVTEWLVVRGRASGAANLHRYRFTDTWVKRGAQWRIVAAQDYLSPAGVR